MITYMTVSETLLAQRRHDGHVTFIEGKHDHRRLSYEDLYQRALMMLYDFQEIGVRAGDQLIILHKDNQTFVEGFWACLLGGIVPVPVAVGISDEHRAKLFRIFNKLERPYLFTSEDNLERLAKYAEHHNLHASFIVVRSKTVITDLLEDHDQRASVHTVHADDVAFIQFSSGSTSEPKGVVLTHRNIMTNLNAIAMGAAYTPVDVSLSWMPLTHDMGLLGFHLNMIAVGMSQCLMPTDLFSRRPLLWLEKVSELKATITCSPNFGYKHYLKALGDKTLDGINLSQVRVIYNGAEPISVELCEQFLTALAPYKLRREAMFTVYGLAEATLAVAFPPVGKPYRALYVNRQHIRMTEKVTFITADNPNAIGFVIEGGPVTDMQIKITDEDNQPLSALAIGLVQIKGPSVTHGYYQDEEANRAALTGDGWLNTGDLGFCNEAGELVITGRYKDIIFAHGQNYYPHDIEAVALQLPELELGKVVACGVRRPQHDADELVIFILFRADLKDFVGVVRDVTRHINEQTGLEVSRVIPVQRIPKTTSGKLQRGLLGDAYLAGEFNVPLTELEHVLTLAHAQQYAGLSVTEQKLKSIFEKSVQDKDLTVQDNFFEMGISSLTLTEIHQTIDDTYPGIVDITDMFEYQTLRELAGFIDSKSNTHQ